MPLWYNEYKLCKSGDKCAVVDMTEKIPGDCFVSLLRKAAVVLLFVSGLLFIPLPGDPSDITTINFRQSGRDVIVNTSLQFDQKIIDDLNAGLPKEISFTVEIVRSRKLWPNEQMKGRAIVRSLRSNPIKREYIGTSVEDGEKTVRRFRDVTSMITWGSSLQELKLSDIEIDEHAEYFIRVSAESRMLALPSVVDYLLFFIPTKEFNVSKETYLFRLSPPQAAK
jgi:hypothetical protein